MPPSLDQAQVALAAQPFSRLLGAQLNSFGPDGVELEVPVRPAHRHQHGFAHGGLLGPTADNALTLVADAMAGPDVLTAGYTSTCSPRSSATPARPGVGHQRWPHDACQPPGADHALTLTRPS